MSHSLIEKTKDPHSISWIFLKHVLHRITTYINYFTPSPSFSCTFIQCKQQLNMCHLMTRERRKINKRTKHLEGFWCIFFNFSIVTHIRYRVYLFYTGSRWVKPHFLPAPVSRARSIHFFYQLSQAMPTISFCHEPSFGHLSNFSLTYSTIISSYSSTVSVKKKLHFYFDPLVHLFHSDKFVPCQYWIFQPKKVSQCTFENENSFIFQLFFS